MKIGFDPYMGTRGAIPAPELVDILADAGYEGMNVVLTPDFVPADNEAVIGAVLERLRARGLSVPTLYFSRDQWILEPGGCQKVREWMETVVRLAERFDAPNIGIGTWARPKNVSHEEELAILRESLGAMLPAAAAAGKRLSVEFETQGALMRYDESLAFVRSVDERICLTPDTYHMLNHKADFHAAAVALRGFIGEVHISGSDRGEPGSAKDVCDHAGLMRGLGEIGYDGWLVAQFNLEDRASIKRSYDFLKRLTER